MVTWPADRSSSPCSHPQISFASRALALLHDHARPPQFLEGGVKLVPAALPVAVCGGQAARSLLNSLDIPPPIVPSQAGQSTLVSLNPATRFGRQQDLWRRLLADQDHSPNPLPPRSGHSPPLSLPPSLLGATAKKTCRANATALFVRRSLPSSLPSTNFRPARLHVLVYYQVSALIP